jgi:CubicO group peptidase (beta-lactamase class C family)
MTHSTLPEGDAKALGFDPDRLAQISPAMQAFVDEKQVPNLITMVVRKGQVVHLEARGVMDFESQEPVNPGTLFRLYSNTKPIAGVATLILYERGLLTPDDPVSKFVPELADLRVQLPSGMTEPARRNITIRDCLTNTTSINTLTNMPMSYRQQYREALETLGMIRSDDFKPLPINSRERMAAMAQIPLADHPGKLFVYHAGYSILGAVLEAAAGQTMEQFFKEQIFKPLGMVDSDFYVPEGALNRLPTCYALSNVDGKAQLVVQEKAGSSEKHVGPRVNFGVGSDAGGVLTTITDYARFGQMLLNGGELDGKRILGRKTVDLMIANHTGDMTIPMLGRGFHFGLGAAVYHGEDTKPRIRSKGIYGWGGAAATTYFADPSEELMGLCFTQVLGTGGKQVWPDNDYQETFQRLVYQSLV